jgi:hypothetical protein
MRSRGSSEGPRSRSRCGPSRTGSFAAETAPFYASLALRVDGFEEADLGFVSLAEGESRDFGVVELGEGPFVAGALVDAETGEALAGVRVTAQPVRERDLFDSLDFARLPETTTGADGTFRLRGLPEGDVRLWIEAPGYAVNRRDVEVLPEGVDLGRVEVSRGEPLEVVVVHPDGTPAGGIAVVIRPGGFDGYLKEDAFVTDGEGRFVVPRIAPGRAAVRATVGTRYVRRLVAVDGDPKLTFRLTGARVEGRVTVNGEPFAGVRVTLWYGPPGRVIATPSERSTPDGIALPVQRLGDWPLEPPTSTDAAGRFVFAEAGEGQAWLRIEGSGWGAEGREIEVPSSGRLRVDFPLGAVELRARLVDAAGVPVSPGRLGVYGDGGLQLASSSVDSEGVAVFYLDATTKARYLRGTDNSGRRGFFLLSEGDLTGGEVVGLVLDEGRGTVVVEAVDGERRPSPGASIHFVNRADGTVGRGRCDREGLLVKPDLPEGRYRVVARGREGGAGEAEVTVPRKGEARVTVRMEDAGKLALRIEAPPEIDPTSLRVRVLDARGRDLAAEEEGLGRKASPDDRGRYTLPADPARSLPGGAVGEGGGDGERPGDDRRGREDDDADSCRVRRPGGTGIRSSHRPLSFLRTPCSENGPSRSLVTRGTCRPAGGPSGGHMSIAVGPLPWLIPLPGAGAGPGPAPAPEDADDGIHVVSATTVERPDGPVFLVVVSWFEDGRWVEREVEVEG